MVVEVAIVDAGMVPAIPRTKRVLVFEMDPGVTGA
jgi:hypothetical protein